MGREKATGAGTLPLPFQFLAAWVGVWVARHQTDQIEYLKRVNRGLMERLGKKRLRFTDAERWQLALLGKKLGRKALAEVATIATPDTILRWYRELVAKKYDGSARRGLGRPRTAAEIVRLLIEMATRNTAWGYTRLRGALKNVGYAVGRNTIKRILKEQGIEPAPLRRRQYSWATFIKAHLSALAAADFFTVEVLSWAGLVRYHVFFVAAALRGVQPETAGRPIGRSLILRWARFTGCRRPAGNHVPRGCFQPPARPCPRATFTRRALRRTASKPRCEWR